MNKIQSISADEDVDEKTTERERVGTKLMVT